MSGQIALPKELTPFELHLHAEGTNHESYRTLGAHVVDDGVRFAVWAPNATFVSVIGDFNSWDHASHPLHPTDAGIWQLFIPKLGPGTHYKYCVRSSDGTEQEKSDPYAFFAEVPPRTASIVWNLDNYAWADTHWMQERAAKNWLRLPVSVYEVHLESWMRGPENVWLTYRELADKLVAYCAHMGYTHVELMPIMEHPFSRLVGLSGYRLLRAHLPLWHTRRVPPFRGQIPPGRHRRDS